MTRNKAQKRATRARMAKTGERYTAARAHVVKPDDQLDLSLFPQSDASARQNTSKGWREWTRILDAWGAKERKHGEIASYLMKEHAVPGWWAQAITVGYERARGMRAKYQRASGVFSVSVSKTIPVGVGKLYAAFATARQRNTWLETGTLSVRTTQKNKSARFDFRDDGSRVLASFEAKARNKATVYIEHERLAGADAVEEMRAFWKERLAALAEHLG